MSMMTCAPKFWLETRMMSWTKKWVFWAFRLCLEKSFPTRFTSFLSLFLLSDIRETSSVKLQYRIFFSTLIDFRFWILQFFIVRFNNWLFSCFYGIIYFLILLNLAEILLLIPLFSIGQFSTEYLLVDVKICAKI